VVSSFEPDLNVAKASPDTVIEFEATRTGLGVADPLDYRAG
jgi:phosphosulfolactate synthase